MNTTHPLTNGQLLEPHTFESLTITEAIERGFETLRGCLLNEAPMPEAWQIVPTLLYLATGRDVHAAQASRPLYDELVDDDVDLTGWVEPLETLRIEMEAAASDFYDRNSSVSVEPSDDDDLVPERVGQWPNWDAARAHGFRVTDHGNGRTTVSGDPDKLRAWARDNLGHGVSSSGMTVEPVARSATVGRASPRSRSSRRRSSRSSPARSSGSDDDPHPEPRLTFRRALGRLLGGRR